MVDAAIEKNKHAGKQVLKWPKLTGPRCFLELTGRLWFHLDTQWWLAQTLGRHSQRQLHSSAH